MKRVIIAMVFAAAVVGCTTMQPPAQKENPDEWVRSIVNGVVPTYGKNDKGETVQTGVKLVPFDFNKNNRTIRISIADPTQAKPAAKTEDVTPKVTPKPEAVTPKQ